MKYNEYSFEKIKKLIADGQKMAGKFDSVEAFTYGTSYNLAEYRFALIGFQNPDYTPGPVRTFYRIGEPRTDGGGRYVPSWNFAEERAEDGVSVVTTAWLHSLKSVFFNTTDEKISARGVYKITGFALPSNGGDDELLIVPLDWAEKTRIRTRSGLEKAVRKSEKK